MGTPSESARPMPSNALAQRVLTAAVLIAVLLPAFVLLPKAFGVALVTLFVLGAAWEWSAFVSRHNVPLRLLYLTAVTAGAAGVSLAVPAIPMSFVALLSLAWWALAFVLILRYPVRLGRAAAAVAGILVLLPAWLGLVALLYTEVGGRKLLLLVLAIVWAADVGAYFSGRRFGRVKLAPRVSPGKTWEGVIGGLVSAALAAAGGAAVLGHAPGPALALGLSVGAISIVGDLAVSMFKRTAGLKDSGNLFPGHGGVLDRVDSLTAAVPLFVLEAQWLGWLG
jgi:phosphatidate cytidylyltransferase